MKKLFYILGLLFSTILIAQTGPTQTINGKVIYGYRPTGSGNTTYLTVDPVTNELEFQPAVSGIPLATPSAAGIAKLYTSTGVNTDGSVTQQAITDALFFKAPLASPTFTGTPTVPTASQGTNTTQAASTAFVQSAVNAIAIKEWSAGTYSEGEFVRKEINGQQYLFKSTSSSNTTEPLLNSQKAAWSPYYLGGVYIGVWNSGTAYVSGNVVDREGFLYYCITGHTNSPPEQRIPPYWFKIGQYYGAFDSGDTYHNGDVVINGSNVPYLSNYDNNEFDLNYGVVSKWEVVNGQPYTVTCWGDSLTFGAGSTGYSNYPAWFSSSTGLNTDNQGVSGETSTEILTRFNAAPEKWKNSTIFWVGTNNKEEPETIKADISEMVSKLGHDRYLVVAIIKAAYEGGGSTVPALNEDLSEIYGPRFVNVQDFLLSKYNPGIAQDVTDHNNGYIAWSITSDWLHLNNLGYKYVSEILASKKNYLTGEGYKSYTNLETGGLRITGNNPSLENTVGGELVYREDLNKFYVYGYNRLADTEIATSVGYSGDAGEGILYLNENGGATYLGNPGVHSTGNISLLGRLASNDQLLTLPSISTNSIPAQASNGTFRNSLFYDNTSEAGVGTTSLESGYKLQSPSFRFGDNAVANSYGGSLNTDFTYRSSRLGGDTKGHYEFVNKFIISATLPADTGSVLQVNGTISAANAVDSDEVVPLGQMNTADALKVDKTNPTITSLPTYADEAAATTGGLTTGAIYKTATGELRIKL